MLAYRRPSALLALVAHAAVLAYRRPSALLALAAHAAVLTDRRPSALLAPVALAAVLAYCRPSALLARAASAAVLAYCRPSALPACLLVLPMLAHVLPRLSTDPPLEPAALERHLLILAVRRRFRSQLALGRGHAPRGFVRHDGRATMYRDRQGIFLSKMAGFRQTAGPCICGPPRPNQLDSRITCRDESSYQKLAEVLYMLELDPRLARDSALPAVH